MRWENLNGTDTCRYCARCNQYLHDASGMTPVKAQEVLGHAWILYRRDDGTLMTGDCPVGAERLRVRAIRAITRCASLIALIVVGSAFIPSAASSNAETIRHKEPVETMLKHVEGAHARHIGSTTTTAPTTVIGLPTKD